MFVLAKLGLMKIQPVKTAPTNNQSSPITDIQKP
jgi:hypothetical protein